MKKLNEKSGALFVGLGIILSRIAGLIRVRVFAHFFGNSDAGDAFNAALKIPNFLQNLFGEGVLSASFIPVYAHLISDTHNDEQNRENKIEAAQVASIIGSVLFIMVSVIIIIGIFVTPFLIDVVAPGFQGAKRDLTIKLVQIIFPGMGLLVMSAWCLGILNSHRKFFLSYVAPVVWNATMIATLFLYGQGSDLFNLAKILAFGLVVGSFLQFIVQLPVALKLLDHFKPSLNLKIKSAQTVVRNFLPVVVSRGVVQVSAYIDSILASLLPMGAVSILAYAQTLYLLPISLFGMSISASELPVMSSIRGSSAEVSDFLRTRLEGSLKKIAFFIVPSICAFVFLGNVLIAAILQTGKFTGDDVFAVWMVLIASSIGLLASTLGRLYSSTYYALKDTRKPLQFAIARVTATTILGYLFAIHLPPLLGLAESWGTAGIALASGLSGWFEFYLLRRSLNLKIGKTGINKIYQIKLWLAGICAAIAGLIIQKSVSLHPVMVAIFVFAGFGIIYFLVTYFMHIEESKNTINKILKKIKR